MRRQPSEWIGPEPRLNTPPPVPTREELLKAVDKATGRFRTVGVGGRVCSV